MEKVIGQSVQKTNQTFLRRYVDDYCKALNENYKQDTIRSLEHNLKRDPECTYSAEQLVKIMQGKANLDKFRYYEGKKYLKVVREEYEKIGPRATYCGGDEEAPILSKNFDEFTRIDCWQEYSYVFVKDRWVGYSINQKFDKDYNLSLIHI